MYVDIRGRDLRGAVQDMQRAVSAHAKLPPGGVGGMTTAPLMSMFVIPAAYLLMRRSKR